MIKLQSKRMQIIMYLIEGLYDEIEEPVDAIDQCVADIKKACEVADVPFNWRARS